MRQQPLAIFLERSGSNSRSGQPPCNCSQGLPSAPMSGSQVSTESMPPPSNYRKPALNFTASQPGISTQIAAAVCNLHIGGEEQSQSLAASQDDTSKLRCSSLPKSLTVEVSRYPSQEHMACTPDYGTPVDQQFQVDYDLSTQQDQEARSPACSPGPVRHIKRARHASSLEEMSEVTSQPSQSSQRSVGEPSTSSKTTSSQPGYGFTLPPVPSQSRQRSRLSRPQSPASYKNPFITGVDTDQRYGVEAGHPRQCPVVTRLHAEFKDIKEIGSGSFSRVFRATHRIDGMSYAIKRTKHPATTDSDRNNWLREVQATAAVQAHPNIMRYYSSWAEADIQGDHLYLQLELCGESLSDVLATTKQAWRETELVALVKQMAAALAHIHSKGMVHLDVKPDNIYRMSDGTYKLGDFGLATVRSGQLPVLEGDARYLAPELLKASNYGSLDKADVFGLGITLYELATGSPLPTGGSVYTKLRKGQLSLLFTSNHFHMLLKQMMAEDPNQRPSAEKVLSSIQNWGSKQALNLTPSKA